jgi:hypothetical protein
MGREYLVGDQLVGKDVETTSAPQVMSQLLQAPGLHFSVLTGCEKHWDKVSAKAGSVLLLNLVLLADIV